MTTFSDLFKQTSGHCYFSPDCSLLASTISFRLSVRDSKNLEVLHVWKCLDEINQLQWSADSTLLLVVLKKRNMVQIFNIDDTSWKCKLDFAAIPVSYAQFTPDSRHVLTSDDLNIRIQLWSLTQKTVTILSDTKSLKKGTAQFGNKIAVLEAKTTKESPTVLQDFLSVLVYNAKLDEWQKTICTKIKTKNSKTIGFSDCGCFIIIKDGDVHDRKLFIYRTRDGKLETQITKTKGEDLKSTVFGWHRNLLIVGKWMEPEISVRSRLTWNEVTCLNHNEIAENCHAVYFEVSRKPPNFETELQLLSSEQAGLFQTGSKFDVATQPYHLPVNTDISSSISWLRLSSSGKFIATQRSDMKRVIFIWQTEPDSSINSKGLIPPNKQSPHSIIEQVSDVTCVAWNPKSEKLAICTGNDKLYLWTEESILSIENPNDCRFCINALRWSPDGKNLILMSKTQMLICFI